MYSLIYNQKIRIHSIIERVMVSLIYNIWYGKLIRILFFLIYIIIPLVSLFDLSL